MSWKHVTGSLLIAKTMSPCSKRFSAFDPAKQPLTRKTCRLTGSFLTSAYNNYDQKPLKTNHDNGNPNLVQGVKEGKGI